MHSTQRIFGVLVSAIALVHCNNRHNFYKRDDNGGQHLHSILKDHDIVPDILDDASETGVLEVIYSGDLCVNQGDELTPTEVQKQPVRVFWNSQPSSYYTLLLIDADSPSRKNPRDRSFQHWVIVNIPGNNVAGGDTLTEYVGAIPGQSTGFHRYVFLVFEQSKGKVEFTEPFVTTRNAIRTKFSVREFMSNYQLNRPVAVNFFKARYDDSVQVSTKRLLDQTYDDQK